jgi:N-acetyl-gamma-glutamyl-phosphate reductase
MENINPLPVAIVGANGYSGEELVRLLLGHPHVRLTAITSRQHAGRPLAEVFPRFAGLPGSDLAFSAPDIERLLASGAECFFLALPHGVAAEFALPLVAAGRRVIDISADFRLRDPAIYEEFYQHPHPAPELLNEAVYGLPETRREAIRTARLLAAPGCYPTSILLPLLPLLRAGLIDTGSIAVASASGTSGAGRKADETLLFAECLGSIRAYGLPKHRHLSEIEQELSEAANDGVCLTFVPHLVPLMRGIHTTIFCDPAPGVEVGDGSIFGQTLREAYADEPFVRVRSTPPDTKHVTGTNFCDVAAFYDARARRVILLSAEDNLVKGAGGQGVQCFNLMFGFPETTGLI